MVRESKGWHSGDSPHLPPMWPGFKSSHRHHMWVEFVLSVVFLLAPKGFSPGTPVFPSPQKPTFPNSNSNWNHFVDVLPPNHYLFIYLFM